MDTAVATFAILALLTGVCTWHQPTVRLSEQDIVNIHDKLVLQGLNGSSLNCKLMI